MGVMKQIAIDIQRDRTKNVMRTPRYIAGPLMLNGFVMTYWELRNKYACGRLESVWLMFVAWRFAVNTSRRRGW